MLHDMCIVSELELQNLVNPSDFVGFTRSNGEHGRLKSRLALVPVYAITIMSTIRVNGRPETEVVFGTLR